MIVLNPMGRVAAAKTEGGLAPRLEQFEGSVIGIIDDGFANSAEFLRGVEEILRVRFENCKTQYWDKPILSRPSPDSLIEEAQACDAVIVGIAA